MVTVTMVTDSLLVNLNGAAIFHYRKLQFLACLYFMILLYVILTVAMVTVAVATVAMVIDS